MFLKTTLFQLKLNPNAKQRTVPASRIGRMVSFGNLAAGLGIGTAAEFARRTLGVSKTPQDTNMFLSPANTERIVNTLCKVRGMFAFKILVHFTKNIYFYYLRGCVKNWPNTEHSR